VTPPQRSLSAATALAIYAVLAVVLTWPLAARVTEVCPAGGNDLWQTWWNFEWWKTALVDRGQSPYTTDLVYQPGEVSLAFHTHSEANVIGTFPVLLALGMPAALNVATLLGFVIAGWGGFLLARELVGRAGPALLSGLIFAWFPQHVDQSLEHLNLASYWGMPFFLLYLVRLARGGGARNVALTGAFFALTSLLSWHNGLLVLFLGTGLFAFEAIRARRLPRAIAEAAVSAAIALAIAGPFLWPMAREIPAGETYWMKPRVDKGIDLAAFLLPHGGHPLWGRALEGAREGLQPRYESAGSTGYIGLAAAALAAWGIARTWPRKRAAFWTAALLLHLALAAGDTLAVLGRDTGIPMPSAFLGSVPVLGTVRVANRWLVPAMLVLAVLAGLGARALTVRLDRRARAGAIAGLAALLVLDYLWVPYPTRLPPRPAYADRVAKLPRAILLDIPSGHRARAAEDMYLQTLHDQPLAGGYTSCTPPWVEERVASLPFLRLVFERSPPAGAIDIEAEMRRAFAALPVGIVVIHLDRTVEALERAAREEESSGGGRLHNPARGIPAATLDRIRTVLRRVWGEPVYADLAAEVYRKP
jgi:hypothetical protein